MIQITDNVYIVESNIREYIIKYGRLLPDFINNLFSGLKKGKYIEIIGPDKKILDIEYNSKISNWLIKKIFFISDHYKSIIGVGGGAGVGLSILKKEYISDIKVVDKVSDNPNTTVISSDDSNSSFVTKISKFFNLNEEQINEILNKIKTTTNEVFSPSNIIVSLVGILIINFAIRRIIKR